MTPAPPPCCTVGAHPKIDDIDRDLVAGGPNNSIRRVAARHRSVEHPLSDAGVQRHREHLRARGAIPADPPPPAGASSSPEAAAAPPAPDQASADPAGAPPPQVLVRVPRFSRKRAQVPTPPDPADTPPDAPADTGGSEGSASSDAEGPTSRARMKSFDNSASAGGVSGGASPGVSDPDTGDGEGEEHLPDRPHTPKERVQVIRLMMERGEWVKGVTGPRLAKKWKCSLSTVEGASAAAHKQIVMNGDLDSAARTVQGAMVDSIAMAREQKDPRALSLAAFRMANMLGLAAPKRHEVTGKNGAPLNGLPQEIAVLFEKAKDGDRDAHALLEVWLASKDESLPVLPEVIDTTGEEANEEADE